MKPKMATEVMLHNKRSGLNCPFCGNELTYRVVTVVTDGDIRHTGSHGLDKFYSVHLDVDPIQITFNPHSCSLKGHASDG